MWSVDNVETTQEMAESVTLKTKHMDVLVPWGDECLGGGVVVCCVS